MSSEPTLQTIAQHLAENLQTEVGGLNRAFDLFLEATAMVMQPVNRKEMAERLIRQRLGYTPSGELVIYFLLEILQQGSIDPKETSYMVINHFLAKNKSVEEIIIFHRECINSLTGVINSRSKNLLEAEEEYPPFFVRK